MYVFARIFKHHILIIQIQIQIRKSNEFDVIECMKCTENLFQPFITKILEYSKKEKTPNSYDCQSLFILLFFCTLIRVVLFFCNRLPHYYKCICHKYVILFAAMNKAKTNSQLFLTEISKTR